MNTKSDYCNGFRRNLGQYDNERNVFRKQHYDNKVGKMKNSKNQNKIKIYLFP